MYTYPIYKINGKIYAITLGGLTLNLEKDSITPIPSVTSLAGSQRAHDALVRWRLDSWVIEQFPPGEPHQVSGSQETYIPPASILCLLEKYPEQVP